MKGKNDTTVVSAEGSSQVNPELERDRFLRDWENQINQLCRAELTDFWRP